jgi:D-amino peptidase
MKVYISADIEGIGCIVRSEQSSPGGREYAWARKMMTEEVNAAIRGAFDGGASEVVVSDSHNVGLNLIPEELDERVSLIMGSPRPLSMLEGIDRGFDLAFLVGYHSMSGTLDSNLVHTFTGRVAELQVNGKAIGEIGISAGLAGYYGVPVGLVTGDDKAAREAQKLLGTVETVEVKKGIGMYAGLCLTPAKSRDLIYKGAKKTMSRIRAFKPFRIKSPVVLQVRFTTTSSVDRALRMPGTERVNNLSVRFKGKHFLEAFKAFNTIADLLDLVAYI